MRVIHMRTLTKLIKNAYKQLQFPLLNELDETAAIVRKGTNSAYENSTYKVGTLFLLIY